MKKCVGLLFLIIVFLFSCSKDQTGPLLAEDSLGADKQKTPVITKQPQSINVEVGAAATFTVKASGAGRLSYQWYKTGSDTMHDTLKDTIIDTGSVLLPGQTKASLVIKNAQLTDNGLYYVVVSNSYGSMQSQYAQLYVEIPQKTPRITQQPDSTAVIPGGTAQFTVKAEGPAPLSYQWYKFGPDTTNDTMNDTVGIPVPGATQATLALKNVQQSNAGYYYAVVSNPYGSTQSWYAELSVDAAPRIIQEPMSVSVKPGATASFSVKANGVTPLSYQWYKWKSDSINDTTNDTTRVANSIPLPGQTKATLVIRNVQQSDEGYYYVVVSNIYGSAQSWFAYLYIDFSSFMPRITQQPVSVSVTAGSTAQFSIKAAGAVPLYYQWYKTTGDTIFDTIIDTANMQFGIPIPGATSATLRITNVQQSHAGFYYAVVSNNYGSTQSSAAELEVQGPVNAPRITQQPVSVTVKIGADAQFSITATGELPLSYQWYKDTAILAGQTNATLLISNITLDDGGYYYAIVSNSYGSARSKYAVLSVDISDKIPVITQQPVSQVVKVGATVTFSVTATGEAPLFYQWEKDSTIIPGQTAPDCTIKNVKQSDLGRYYVTVTNSWGTAMSNWAFLSFVGDSLAPIRK